MGKSLLQRSHEFLIKLQETRPAKSDRVEFVEKRARIGNLKAHHIGLISLWIPEIVKHMEITEMERKKFAESMIALHNGHVPYGDMSGDRPKINWFRLQKNLEGKKGQLNYFQWRKSSWKSGCLLRMLDK